MIQAYTEKILRLIKKYIPEKIFKKLAPAYHYTLAFIAALLYRFPSRKIFVIGVTGTKGKTTVVELLGAILTEAGYAIALSDTLRFAIKNTSRRNTFKMTMPGRFFLQRFLHKAVRKKIGRAHV